MKNNFILICLVPIACHGAGITLQANGRTISNIEVVSKDISVKNLSVLGLTLADSNFADVRKTLGFVAEIPRGAWGTLCYTGKYGPYVLFGSEATRPRDIQSVTVASQKPSDATGFCPLSPKVDNRIVMLGGVHLGMTQREVELVWGKPGRKGPDYLIYMFRQMEFLKKIKYEGTDFENYTFTDDISLYFEFTNGKLSYLEAGKTRML